MGPAGIAGTDTSSRGVVLTCSALCPRLQERRGWRRLRRRGLRPLDRADQRPNGHRRREFHTRAGTLDVAIPKLRSGSYFPDWLLERRRRAERALTTVVATCYLRWVSTRRMEKLVESLGITRLSKSQFSENARDIDEQ